MSRLTTTPVFAAGEVHSPLRLGILAHLKAKSPSSIFDIQEGWASMEGLGARPAINAISGALYRLRGYGLVHRTISGSGGIQWFYGAEPGAQVAASAEAIDQPPGQIVPPRQFDVMNAPVYRASPGPALRHGALDFLRHPSVGVRC